MCNEAVLWTVSSMIIPVSMAQLQKFRELKDTNGAGIADNFRPIQALNDRTVYVR